MGNLCREGAGLSRLSSRHTWITRNRPRLSRVCLWPCPIVLCQFCYSGPSENRAYIQLWKWLTPSISSLLRLSGYCWDPHPGRLFKVNRRTIVSW